MPQSDQDIRNRLLVARLPVIPQILLKLMELCQVDGAGMAELAKLIANDAGMTAKILGVANSAAYHRGGRKVGLLQALSILGADIIKTVVISESVFQTFNGFPHSAGSDLRSYWKHALTAAVLAREIGKKMGYPHIEEAYLAGLLHDVGRLALLAVAPGDYSANFLAQDDENLCVVEQRTLQITHAEAGAWLVERWNLDSFMADSILYHHESIVRLEGAHPLIRIVHLAHLLSEHAPELPLAADVGSLCKITVEDLSLICLGAAAQVKKAAEYLGIDLSGIDDLVAPAAIVPAAPMLNPAQKRLTDEVRNMALIAEIGQSFARQTGKSELLEGIRCNANIFFNLEDAVIFLLNGNAQSLVTASVGEQRLRLVEFSIPMSGGGGAVESVLRKRPAFLERNSNLLTLSEKQLLRLFNAECLLCIPLVAGTRCLGIVAAGVTSWRVMDLKLQQNLLQSFGVQAGTALEKIDNARSDIDRRIADLNEGYRENARKVVHEINNPLSIIKNYLSVLNGKLSRQESVGSELLILNDEIDRVGNIVSEFAGVVPKAKNKVFEINCIINDLIRLFRESKFLPSAVDIVARLSSQEVEIYGSPDILKQILINLLKNSVEALPQGGRIEIVSGGLVYREGREFFELSIKDNGPGIPKNIIDNLFAPVNSSKSGSNRGIGLSIVHSLVKQINGLISCTSTGSGTVFEILLPARSFGAEQDAALDVA